MIQPTWRSRSKIIKGGCIIFKMRSLLKRSRFLKNKNNKPAQTMSKSETFFEIKRLRGLFAQNTGQKRLSKAKGIDNPAKNS